MRVVVRIALAASTAVLLCGLGGCSSLMVGSAANPAAGARDPGTPVHLSPVARRTPVVRPNLLTRTEVNGLTSLPWILTSLDNKTATIEVFYVTGDGDCVKPRGIYLRQTSSSVLVDVLSTTAADRTDCASSLALERSVLHLDQPLGSRTLIHARVSYAWDTQNFFRGLTA